MGEREGGACKQNALAPSALYAPHHLPTNPPTHEPINASLSSILILNYPQHFALSSVSLRREGIRLHAVGHCARLPSPTTLSLF